MGEIDSQHGEIARRLRLATPKLLEVLLFGSRARGDQRPDSDVDLVLIIPEGADRTELLLRSRKSLRHLGVGFDLLLVTPSHWSQMCNDRSYLVRELVHDARRLGTNALQRPSAQLMLTAIRGGPVHA